MERAVMSRCGVEIVPRVVPRADGHECQSKPGRLQSVPMPAELRLQEDGSGR